MTLVDFLVAYKRFPEIDAETLKKYPFLKGYVETLESDIVGLGSWREYCQIKTVSELEKFFMEYFGYADYICLEELFAVHKVDKYMRDEGSFVASNLQEIHEKCERFIKDGYMIVASDDEKYSCGSSYRQTMIQHAESMGDNIVLVSIFSIDWQHLRVRP